MSPMPSFDSPFSKTTPNVSAKDNTKPAGDAGNPDDIEGFLGQDDVDDSDVKDKKDTKSKKEEDDDDEVDDTLESKVEEDDEEDKDDEEEDDKVELKEDVEDEEEDKEKLDLKEDDEDTKLTTPPRVKEIEAKFPEFFKEFPFMKRMMFRDKAYTEMFGSFDEAKEINNKVEQANEFEAQLLSGNMRNVLNTVKDTDPKAFDKIVDSFLKQLAEVDKSAYDDVTQNFAKQIVQGIAEEAKRKKDEKLDNLAKELHQWLFDTDQWQDYKVRVPASKSEEETKVDKERQELMRERFESARDGLSVKVDNILKATISDYIDPRGQMSNYEKKTAIAETLDRLHNKIAQDATFRKNLDRLWRASMGDKFSENSLAGIKKSYLGKAKGLLTSVIKEVRGEVLKDNRSKGKDKKDETTSSSSRLSETRKPVNAGRPHQQNIKANERKPGESVADFFDRE